MTTTFSLSLTFMISTIALATGFGLGVIAGKQLLFRKNFGEALVIETIARQFQRQHVLLNNLSFGFGGETCQIDHVLVTDTGIYVIETKHYSGWIFGNPADPHWTQVHYKKRTSFRNPVRQNYGHLKTLQRLFSLPNEAFFPIVVFTGTAEFETDLGPQVLRLHEMIPYLETERAVVLDERKMAYVVGRIEMQRCRRSIEADEYHINSVRARVRMR